MLPYNRFIAPILFERLYGGIGEKSIGIFQKSVEFSPTTLINRSVTSHLSLHFLQINDPIPSMTEPIPRRKGHESAQM